MQKDLNFLILDEPTNHLDIDSREVLEEAIEHFEGTILAVSHDRYFLNKLFTKTFWLYEKRLHSFDGNYSWAREKMKGVFAEKEVPSMEVPKLVVKKSNDVKQAPGPAEIERQIDQHENELFRLEEQMLSLTDLAQLMELNRLKEEKEKQIEWLYEQLEAIS
jgi:ATPase subunit of ABC transporter with duplicated ATPase domains